MYNFKRLIKKYAKSPVYELVETDGYRDYENGGIWVGGTMEEILIEDGAVIPLSNDDLKLDEGGTYTIQDKKLYCYKEMKAGTKVKYKEKEYTVMESKDYADFDIGLFIYILKRGGND